MLLQAIVELQPLLRATRQSLLIERTSSYATVAFAAPLFTPPLATAKSQTGIRSPLDSEE